MRRETHLPRTPSLARRGDWRRWSKIALVWAICAGAAAARAHVVYTPTTLSTWVNEADLIAVVEIVQPLRVWRAPDGSDLQEYISVRVVDVLRGSAPANRFDYLPHSEGEPRYRAGDRALLFLEKTAPRAEYAKLHEFFPYFSRQGAGSEWKLASLEDPAIEMARAWDLLRGRDDVDATRALLLRELTLAEPRLRTDAILELVRFRARPDAWPDAVAVRPFAALADDPSFDVASRVALLRVLDGAPGVDTAASLLALTAAPLRERDRKVVVSAASLSRDPRLSAWLAAQLDSRQPRRRRQAATALAHPWHAAHVAKLVEVALEDGDESVARSATQALAAIGDAPARAGLQEVAEARRDSVAATARRLLRERVAPAAPAG